MEKYRIICRLLKCKGLKSSALVKRLTLVNEPHPLLAPVWRQSFQRTNPSNSRYVNSSPHPLLLLGAVDLVNYEHEVFD